MWIFGGNFLLSEATLQTRSPKPCVRLVLRQEVLQKAIAVRSLSAPWESGRFPLWGRFRNRYLISTLKKSLPKTAVSKILHRKGRPRATQRVGSHTGFGKTVQVRHLWCRFSEGVPADTAHAVSSVHGAETPRVRWMRQSVSILYQAPNTQLSYFCLNGNVHCSK